MGEKGFTLIEMLLVVAIIGFLVAILLPSVGGFGATAKDNAVKADLRQLKSALEVYFISFAAYPPDDATWGTKDSPLLTADGTAGYERIIDQFPVDGYGETGVANNDGTFNYDLDGNTYIATSDKPNPGSPGNCVATDASDRGQTGGAALYVSNAREIISP
jgi:general secretion pathway protein G